MICPRSHSRAAVVRCRGGAWALGPRSRVHLDPLSFHAACPRDPSCASSHAAGDGVGPGMGERGAGVTLWFPLHSLLWGHPTAHRDRSIGLGHRTHHTRTHRRPERDVEHGSKPSLWVSSPGDSARASLDDRPMHLTQPCSPPVSALLST